MRILHVDLTQRTTSLTALEDPFLGGRWLTAEILAREVDPGCDPLGSENRLVLATGALAGWGIGCAGRLSVGGKSPLTGGIKESNAGGDVADALAGLNYRAVVFAGEFPEDRPGLVVLDEGETRFLPAAGYWGLRLEETAARLRSDFGAGYALLAIGPAGELCLPAAGIAGTDVRGDPFRLAARGGLAAVMGRKGLKAVLVKRARRQRPAGEAFGQAVRAYHKTVNGNPRVEVLRQYGTASTIMLVQTLGGLPTNNFSQGTFPEAERLSGEALRSLIESRGGEGTPTDRCMPVCTIQCSNIYPDAAGKRLVAPIEYETLVMCGSNLGIGDPDVIARINQLCNDLGLDTIEVGATLGVAAEAGLLGFGDGQKAVDLVEEIGRGTVLGRLLGQGCAVAGRVLGVRRTPVVKGQALSAYDPRGVKGTGVTFATSPQGADHTAGLTVFAPVDHHAAGGQVALSRSTQIARAAYDALGLCAFLLSATGGQPQLLTDMLAGAYECPAEPGLIAEIGRRTIRLERDFNRRAGLTEASDRLPSYFRTEPLSPNGLVFDVPDAELDEMWGEL